MSGKLTTGSANVLVSVSQADYGRTQYVFQDVKTEQITTLLSNGVPTLVVGKRYRLEVTPVELADE